MGYSAPTSLADALEQLDRREVKIIAGGTDFYPALGDAPAPADILDVTNIPEFSQITQSENGWRIGAATRWTQVIKTSLPACFDGLKQAAKEVGSIQIQNAGTVAGNLCNASPAADGVPPLLTLGAQVEIVSKQGTRVVPPEEFIQGVRRVDLRPGELVSAILVPHMPDNAQSSFVKLGARRYLVISIAMVGVVIWANGDGRIAGVRIAVGACSEIATRLRGLEDGLIGLSVAEVRAADDLWRAYLGELRPISDVRGSAEFRQQAVAELCKRAVLRALVGEGMADG